MGAQEVAKRNAVRAYYKSDKWDKKLSLMSDRQVHMIWQRLVNEKKI